MINRTNWLLVQEYLAFRNEVDQLLDTSLRLEKGWIRFFLEWVAEKPLSEITKIRPTFPVYVLTHRMDGGEEQLSPVYIRKVIRTAVNFLLWVKTHHVKYAHVLAQSWLDTLKPHKLTVETKETEAVTIEEIIAIANAPVHDLIEKRIRAAAVFWFLSGIRVGAFLTLPILAVDLDNLTIKQWPKLGVHTKFSKHATTFLLNIPELLPVIKNWDKELRDVLPGNAYWFANLIPESGILNPHPKPVNYSRESTARKNLKLWLLKNGLPYHSPHKFRHGHAVYGIKHAKDIQALKAISQNLMHANLSVTDGIYGCLSDLDVKGQINLLGNQPLKDEDDIDKLITLITERLKIINSKKISVKTRSKIYQEKPKK